MVSICKYNCSSVRSFRLSIISSCGIKRQFCS
nr:MAG TPA: hypothetical protein [Caudoviricetes sp.]